LEEDLTYLQLAFNTAKHEATGATPIKVIFPFHGDMPLLHQMVYPPIIPKNKTWTNPQIKSH
jgi:hypothetical protein